MLTVTYEFVRRLQTTLAYAYFKVEHGLQDSSFRLIEPFVIEGIKRKRYLSEGSHDTRAFSARPKTSPTLNLIAEEAGHKSAAPTSYRAISSIEAFGMTQPSLNSTSTGESALYASLRSIKVERVQSNRSQRCTLGFLCCRTLRCHSISRANLLGEVASGSLDPLMLVYTMASEGLELHLIKESLREPKIY